MTQELKTVYKKPYAHLIFIMIIGAIAYSNTFNVPFHFDDVVGIHENPIVKDLSYFLEPSKAKGLKIRDVEIYGMFLNRYAGFFTLALNYLAHGLNVAGYHAVNLIIHIFSAVCIYFIVIFTFRTPRLTSSRLSGSSHFIAFFSAALFVSHPVQTQAVTYIVQRLASLATLFYLCSLLCYIKSRCSERNVPRYAFYCLSLVSAVLAMKTKEISFTLPVVLVLYELIFFGGKIMPRLQRLIPLCLTILIVPLSVLSGISVDGPVDELVQDIDSVTALREYPRLDYLYTELRVIVTYIRLLFFPVRQNLYYDYPIYHSLLATEVLLSILLLLSIFTLGVYLLIQSEKRDNALRLISFGIFWFFITLSVESVIPLHVIYEHRVYLPSVGFLLAVVTSIAYFLAAVKNRKVHTSATAFLIIVTIVLSAATYARNQTWKSVRSMWEDVVRKSPENARAHNNLGHAYYESNLVDEAIEEYLTALRLEPLYGLANMGLCEAYIYKGLVDRAKEHCNAAIMLAPGTEPYNRIGNIYFEEGNIDTAIKYYRLGVERNVNDAGVRYNLGFALYKKGQIENALKYLESSQKLNPSLIESYEVLAHIYTLRGLTDMAIEQYARLIKLKPGSAEPHFKIGTLYWQRGQINKSIEHMEMGIGLSADNAAAHNNLGTAYFATGNIDGAIKHFEISLEIQPGNYQTLYNMGLAYQKIGRHDKASEYFRAAEEIKNPKN